jgi:hemin uptake protein HemP
MASGSDEPDPATPAAGASWEATVARPAAQAIGGASRLPMDDEAIPSEMLLGGRSEIRIRHRGEIYRLSLTRAGKLILHK